MFRRISILVGRLQFFCLTRLMRAIAKQKQSEIVSSNDAFSSLLQVWNQLIASRGANLTADTVTPALQALLASQKHASAVFLSRSLMLNQLPPEVWPMIPSLEVREVPVMNTWTFQNEVMKWDIDQSDLVLDIGAGGWPFKRANHLADKFPDETSHRVESMVRDERPFFEVDLEKLSFNDQSYDFVFCSHVLEHIDNPGLALRELMRVGRRGYIEVPTRLSDVMFNFTRLPNHHRWHGMVLGDTLLLVEWNDWERRDLGNHFFNALHSEHKNAFQDFFDRNRDLFFASYHWNESIKFLIIDKQGRVVDSSGDRS